jgi:hypothetical protein
MCSWANTNESVSVVTIQLLKARKLYTWIWKNDAISPADAELKVAPGNADAATGSNQPQMLNEEMEEDYSSTRTSRFWGKRRGSKELIGQADCEVNRKNDDVASR